MRNAITGLSAEVRGEAEGSSVLWHSKVSQFTVPISYFTCNKGQWAFLGWRARPLTKSAIFNRQRDRLL